MTTNWAAVAVSIEEDLKEYVNPQDVANGVQKACFMVEADAKRLCPVMTGSLRASINSKVKRQGTKIEGWVGTPSYYAPFVEFGTGLFAVDGGGRKTPWTFYDEELERFVWTKGQHPHPFLVPALEKNIDNITKCIEGGIGKNV